jgi:hypothetical protein
MTDQVEILIRKTRWNEGSSFVATAYFRDRGTAAADAPATVKYRIDCKTTGRTVLDWTDVSAAASVAISVTSTHNAILNDCNGFETKQLTVAGDYGAADQSVGVISWTVENLYGTP